MVIYLHEASDIVQMANLQFCYNKGCAQKFDPEENSEGNGPTGCYQSSQIPVITILESQSFMMPKKSGPVVISTAQTFLSF